MGFLLTQVALSVFGQKSFFLGGGKGFKAPQSDEHPKKKQWLMHLFLLPRRAGAHVKRLATYTGGSTSYVLYLSLPKTWYPEQAKTLVYVLESANRAYTSYSRSILWCHKLRFFAASMRWLFFIHTAAAFAIVASRAIRRPVYRGFFFVRFGGDGAPSSACRLGLRRNVIVVFSLQYEHFFYA